MRPQKPSRLIQLLAVTCLFPCHRLKSMNKQYRSVPECMMLHTYVQIKTLISMRGRWIYLEAASK
jgi:hypothetical protein